LWLLALSCTPGHGADTRTQELSASSKEPLPVRLQIVIFKNDGKAAMDREDLQIYVDTASKILSAAGVTLLLEDIVTIHLDDPAVKGRAGRNALAAKCSAPNGMIQIFVTQSIQDIDNPDSFIAGVHWKVEANAKRPGKPQLPQPARRYIILAISSLSGGVLAHELGHWFGLEHVKDSKNLMNNCAVREGVKLDKRQAAAIHDFALGALQRGELKRK
jgi:hypothetical protein